MSRARAAPLALLVALAVVLLAVALDARARRAAADRRAPLLVALVRATGSADLALSSGTSWLRHPTSAAPADACVGPTCLDTDPAGLALPPARETFARDTDRTLFRVPEPR